jgi:L-ascorbate metabolism protein UlaG (beta-lactamase superfamily)
MATQLTFFGVAGYQIVQPDGTTILVDPFLEKNVECSIKVADLKKVDLILVTHGAFDHVGDAAEIAKKFKAPVVCGVDVKMLLEDRGVDPDQLRVTIWGMWMKLVGVQVRPVESHHWSFSKTRDGQLLSGPAIGYIVETEPGIRIYHPADTAISYDLKLFGELYKPTVGLMHVSLPCGEGIDLPHHYMYQSGELTPYEAALASQWLRLDHVIPNHYSRADHPDVAKFVDIMESFDRGDGTAPKVSVMRPGDTITLEPTGKTTGGSAHGA